MDGSLGTAWWLSRANKRDQRIGEHMNGTCVFKMECAHGMVRRKLWMRTYLKKGIAGLSHRLLGS